MLAPRELSKTRYSEFVSLMKRLGKGSDAYWGTACLQLKPLNYWEEWGFGLVMKADFQEQIDEYLKINKDEIHEFVDNPKVAGYEERRKALYGAGPSGWTKEGYQRIMNAYKNGRLTIGSIRAIREEDFALQPGETAQDRWNWIKANSKLPKYYSEVMTILAMDKPEEKLSDEERIILLAYAHALF